MRSSLERVQIVNRWKNGSEEQVYYAAVNTKELGKGA